MGMMYFRLQAFLLLFICAKGFSFINIGRVIEQQTRENDMVIKYKIRESETGYRTQKWGK